ncbi:TPA: MBL fold metallo-hydrolase [Pseudomonas aeruginosa]|nr:MBL fold metallo-hydrolase [Pseudomonas aeruginosa]
MEKLIALPIKGESFLLRRAGKTVLVDGGYNSLELSRALKAHAPDLQKIDIVVCSHADRDHAGGLINLISTSGLSVGEFWLPGTWGDSIPELINDPESTVSGLLSELDQCPTGWPIETQKDHEAVAHHFETKAAEERRAVYSERLVHDFSRDEVPQSVDPLWNPLHQAGESLDGSDYRPLSYTERRLFTRSGRAFEKGRRKIRDRRRNGTVSPQVASYWLELIDAAQAIRAIAVQALAFGVKVRWFDYSAFAKSRRASGGDAGFLEPLNAIEMPPPPP